LLVREAGTPSLQTHMYGLSRLIVQSAIIRQTCRSVYINCDSKIFILIYTINTSLPNNFTTRYALPTMNCFYCILTYISLIFSSTVFDCMTITLLQPNVTLNSSLVLLYVIVYRNTPTMIYALHRNTPTMNYTLHRNTPTMIYTLHRNTPTMIYTLHRNTHPP